MSVAATRLLLITLAVLGLLLSTAVSAQSSQILELDNSNNTQTFTAKDGQMIDVDLSESSQGGYTITYEKPTSSDEKVVAAVADSEGSFKAVGAAAEGTAKISANGTCTGEGCPSQVDPWYVTITVPAIA
ncbi:hypothetical protein BGZ75_004365 [Mortierella antarctica]|nr:hypothetical protein BGZ67_007028 [Mortierella alpina]KAF9984083.1 hypothetical protein BGZ75_004365 [Mortierella antarctica]